MVLQKRCLNCGSYQPDDKDLKGNPIPHTIPMSFSFAGICLVSGKRVKDTWSCGGWSSKTLEQIRDKQIKRME